jgi:hypothetical protein
MNALAWSEEGSFSYWNIIDLGTCSKISGRKIEVVPWRISIILVIAHCLRRICYTEYFRSCLYSCVQGMSCNLYGRSVYKCQAIPFIFRYNNKTANHSGHAVQDMNRLRPLEHWGRGFESHSRHGCLYMFIL